MPRKDEPKLDVRFSTAGMAAVQAAARSADVKPGTLVRECAERYAVQVARDLAAARREADSPSSGNGVSVPSQSPVAPAAGADRAAFFRAMQTRRP